MTGIKATVCAASDEHIIGGIAYELIGAGFFHCLCYVNYRSLETRVRPLISLCQCIVSVKSAAADTGILLHFRRVVELCLKQNQ